MDFQKTRGRLTSTTEPLVACTSLDGFIDDQVQGGLGFQRGVDDILT